MKISKGTGKVTTYAQASSLSVEFPSSDPHITSKFIAHKKEHITYLYTMMPSQKTESRHHPSTQRHSVQAALIA